jgi:hypothetical protein
VTMHTSVIGMQELDLSLSPPDRATVA